MSLKRNYLDRFAPKFTREEKYLGTFMAVLILSLTINGVWDAMNREVRAYNPLLPKAEAAVIEDKPDELLLKIAECESGGKQFHADGRVVLNVNKDGSADVGKWQVNLRYHGAEIARMKLDVINSEEDNEKFALYLYQRNGTADWQASKHCWSK